MGKYLSLIKVFKQKNKGACAARNKAFSESSGDYIQWLDSDDILEIDKIEKQLSSINFVKKTDKLLSCSFARFYSIKNKSKFTPNNLWKDLIPHTWIRIYLEDIHGTILQHCWLVSRQLCIKAGPWREDILVNQDGEYFSRVVLNSSFVKFVPEAICYYRTGNLGSVSNNRSLKKLASLIDANISIVNNALEKFNDSEIRNAAIKFLQDFYSSILYSDDEIKEIKKLTDLLRSLGGAIPPKKESGKFSFVKKILGLKRARELKLFFWNLEVKLRKLFDTLIPY